jgi:hypothetical protein
MTPDVFVVEVIITDEIKSLGDEYKGLNAKRLALEQAHPYPSGSYDFDYLVLRDDPDYRWYCQRMNEISETLGALFTAQITGIKR